MATPTPFDKSPQNPKTNAHGVEAPVRPRKVTANDSFDRQLKHVTQKHRKSIELLSKR